MNRIPSRSKQYRSKRLEESDGIETGYVTDSSFSSRKDSKPKSEPMVERQQANRRKTKSERDKRRSSRISVSLLEGGSGSESSSLEQPQSRYRRRAGSKRSECEYKENQPERYRKRAESKNSQPLERIDSVKNTSRNSTIMKEDTTLRMNSKDIYCGTWNPNERAVLDQILINVNTKPDRRSLKNFLRRKDHKVTKDTFSKVTEEVPLSNQNFCQNEKTEKKKSIFSGLKKWRENVLKKNVSKNDFILLDDSNHNDLDCSKKKRGLFERFGRKKEEDYVPRRRAHSTNEYSTHQRAQTTYDRKNHTPRNRCGSTNSLKSMFHKTKSTDNLHGAFEYFAHNKQVFQRTPSATRLDKRSTSTEKIDRFKRSSRNKRDFGSSESRDTGYNDKLVHGLSVHVKPHEASQKSLQQMSYSMGQCDSAFEDDCSLRGYQSERAFSAMSAYPACNVQNSDSDCGSYRAYTSMAGYCYNSPTPIRYIFPPANPSKSRHGSSKKHSDKGYKGHITPGSVTPGYATPGYVTPVFGTPVMQRSFLCEQVSPPMAPYHVKRALERSIPRNNQQGYFSESSYCDDDEETYSQNKYDQDTLTRKPYKGYEMSTVL